VLQDYFDDGSGREPRYYQRNAINAATEAIAKDQDRPELKTQRLRTGQLIDERRQGFKARTGQEMSPGNVWLAGRLQEQDALGRIIVRIEQARLADGSVHALRGAGVAARTDAITAEMDGSHHDAR
jgi:hypothetical protein